MSAAPRPRGGLGAALAGLALALALMAVLWGDLSNPDWSGYALVYEEGGAWLTEQRRDPLFVALVAALRGLFGPDGYLAFRYAVAAYFLIFTFALLRGRVLHFDRHAMPRWPLLLLGMLPFVAPRFTIQIREGIALTLVLCGMAWLSAPEERRDARIPAAIVLFGAASLLHSGVALLLLALVAGLLVRRACMQSIHLELWVLLVLGAAATLLGAGIAIAGLASPAGQQLVESVYDAQTDTETTLSVAKWAYWGAYGLGVAALGARVRRLYGEGRLPPALRPVLGLVALVILPALYVAALLLLAGGLPAIVIAGAARLMNMLLSTTLLVLALRGVLTPGLGLFALLVVVDQARVIVEAVLSLAPPEL